MSGEPTYAELKQKVRELTLELEQIKTKEKTAQLLNELFAAVLNRIPDPVCVKDENHCWVIVNDKFCEYAGAPREELLGKSNYDVFSQKEAEIFWKTDNEVLRLGTENLDNEYISNLVTDKKAVLNIKKSLYKNKQGKTFILAVCRDITKQEKAENELKFERSQLLSIFNSINQIIYVTDPYTYEILYVNETLKGLLQKDPVGGLCYKEFQGFNEPCPFCTNHIILKDKNTPYQWEHHHSAMNMDSMIIDRIIKWPDGRDVRLEIAIDISDHKKAEAALRESNLRLKLALKFSNIGLFDWNPETQEIYFSPEWKSQLGYADDEIENRYEAWESLLHPEDRERATRTVREFLEESKKKYEQEFRLRHKDGSYRWILSRAELIEDHKEQYERLLGCHFDLTDLKKSKEAISESEKRFRELSELLPETIFETDEWGNLTFVNQAAFDHFGYTHEDFGKGLNIFEMIPPEDSVAEVENFSNIMNGEKMGLTEITALKKNGDTFPALINSTAITKDGASVGIRGCVVDLTELKKAEDALRDSEARYRNVVEDMPAMICRFLPDGTLTFVNGFYCSYFGKKKEELTGQNFIQFVPEGEREKVIKYFTSLDAKTPIVTYEQKTFVPGKGLRWQEWTDRALFDPHGNVVEYQAIGRDITDIKIAREEKIEMERRLQQSQKMEAIGTLSGGIAHDFNNILSAIIGYAEMLGMFDIPEGTEARSSLDGIFNGVYRAKELVNQILTFSRQADQEKKPVRLSRIVNEALKFLRASLPATIKINQNIESRKSLILADSTQMHQIVMNLCTNAAHAMRMAPGVLNINLAEVELDEKALGDYTDLEAGSYVRLTISDTGHGISPENINRIFDPYFTTKETGEGTGLGLAVVHGIVKAHNGAINVSSELGRGSVFQVYLPALKLEPALVSGRSPEPLPKGNECILFVDDEPILVTIWGKILENFGYQVVLKDSSAEALETFRADPDRFDMVITDMTMPNLTGIDLSKAMLSIRPELPIVLCTGFSELISPDTVRETGIRALMMKPLSLRDLLEKIRKVLDD